jgi:uncharacterized metal-binding protein YceD (DUF177 family)
MAELDWKIAVRDIPAAGLDEARTATGEELVQLAAQLDIPAVEHLAIRLHLTPRTRDRYRLTGTIEARVVQTCVVTLEPVTADIRNRIDVELHPAETIDANDEIEAGESLLEEPDIEPIVNGTVDLGRIVYEEIASSLDPYPRKAGETLEQTEAGAPTEAEHPFARLAALRRPPDQS